MHRSRDHAARLGRWTYDRRAMRAGMSAASYAVGCGGMTRLSVLDVSPIVQGGDAAESLRNTIDLASHAEDWGYCRYWLAEHHNNTGIASAATAVVIAYVAASTSAMRIGAGGIMLPNHAPLIVAEQFGTLASMHTGRIDLGVGRALGADPVTAGALRRNLSTEVDAFRRDLLELMSYFRPPLPGQVVRAVPGAGLDVPVWILGSSLSSAQLAAQLGLPYAFASHFAPNDTERAVALYRRTFQPAGQLAAPYVMLGLNVCAADTDNEAKRLFSSYQQSVVYRSTGHRGPLPPPAKDFESRLEPAAKMILAHALSYSVVGSPETVRRGLDAFIRRTGADEIIVASQIFDHSARLRSYEIVAQVHDSSTVALKRGSSPSCTSSCGCTRG
jgi:luciferase family oxidoreductase group 1